MWQLLFTIAFSAVPLTLYLPPLRSLNQFVESMEDLARESRRYTNRVYPRARHVWSRILDCMLCNNMRWVRESTGGNKVDLQQRLFSFVFHILKIQRDLRSFLD